MIESILLTVYAAASVALAFWIRRAFKLRLDWSHPDIRRPVFDGRARSFGGEGALGAADAVSTAALSSASPSVVMMAVIAAAGLFGGFIGAGVLPALAGGIGQPGWIGMLALVVAMLAWVWIGGTLAVPVLALALGLAPILIGLGVVGFLGMAFWQNFNAGTSLITLGNPWHEIDELLDDGRCDNAVPPFAYGVIADVEDIGKAGVAHALEDLITDGQVPKRGERRQPWFQIRVDGRRAGPSRRLIPAWYC